MIIEYIKYREEFVCLLIWKLLKMKRFVYENNDYYKTWFGTYANIYSQIL